MRSPSVDLVEAAVAVALVAVAAVSLAGLALAEAGLFTRVTLTAGSIVALAFVMAAVRALARQDGLRVRPTPAGHWMLLTLVLAASVFAFRPPADVEIDAGDASVYVATGRLIAAEGGLRPSMSSIVGLDAGIVEGMLARDRLPPPLPNLFPGGIQMSEDGRLEPGFFHLASIWVAIWTVWFGTGPLWITPAFGWLAIALVWCAGRRLWSAAAASMATLMLVANFAQIWFARIPVSEGIAETLVAAAAAAFVVAVAESSASAAMVAGLAAGLAAFSRIDVLLLVSAPLAGLAIFMLVARLGPARPLRWFLAAVLATSGYAVAHVVLFASAYVERVYTMLFEFDWSGSRQVRAIIPVAVVAMAAVGVGAYLIRRRTGAAGSIGAVGAVGARASGALGATGAVGARVVAVVAVVAIVAIVAVVALWRLSNPYVMLVTPGAALLAAAGLAMTLNQDRLLRALPVVSVFLASALVYVPGPLDRTGMPMMLRRFLPVLLPMGFVLAGGAFEAAWRWWSARLTLVPIAALSVVLMWGDSRVLFSARPYAAVRGELDRIVQQIPANALVFVDRNTPSHFGLALQAAYRRSTLFVTATDPAASARAAVDRARADGRPIRLVVAPENVESRLWGPDAFGRLTLAPLGVFPLDYTALRSETGFLPVSPVPISRSIAVYDVAERAPERTPLPLRLDVGPLDLTWWPTGVHGAELMQGATARWTDGDAGFLLPPLDVDPARAVVIRVRLAAERPAGFAHPAVTLALDDERLGGFAASAPGFGEYEVVVPAGLTRRLEAGGRLHVVSETFVPAEHGSPGDTRRLGVAVDWIDVGEGHRES